MSGAFANGDQQEIGAGGRRRQTVTYGVTASDVATGLMQALKDIAEFDAGGSGNFSGSTNLDRRRTLS